VPDVKFLLRFHRRDRWGEIWAWVELNYRPHACQAASYEHDLGSEVPTRLPFTNILLSISRIQQHLARFRERFAYLNGHHERHRVSPGGRTQDYDGTPRARPPDALAHRPTACAEFGL